MVICIADVLDMTVEDAQAFFQAVPSIREKMDALVRVGLGYIKVGQQATTLSGGEAQRVKLAKELGCPLPADLYTHHTNILECLRSENKRGQSSTKTLELFSNR